MKSFQIISSAGVEMGIYRANSKGEALEAMARDAGAKSYADACEVCSVSADYDSFDGTVKEIEVELVYGFGEPSVKEIREAEDAPVWAFTADYVEFLVNNATVWSVTPTTWAVIVPSPVDRDVWTEMLEDNAVYENEAVPDSFGLDPWFVWKHLDDGEDPQCIIRAESKGEALELAARLGADQIQHGIDGEVVGV